MELRFLSHLGALISWPWTVYFLKLVHVTCVTFFPLVGEWGPTKVRGRSQKRIYLEGMADLQGRAVECEMFFCIEPERQRRALLHLAKGHLSPGDKMTLSSSAPIFQANAELLY